VTDQKTTRNGRAGERPDAAVGARARADDAGRRAVRARARVDAAMAAQSRADDAYRRAEAARDEADRATTDYARNAHRRVADLHAALAISHEEDAHALSAIREDPEPT
jgi:hypothetical protein